MRRLKLDEFLLKAITKYPLYDYSKINFYKNNTMKIEVICKEHGSFITTPNILLHPKTICPCPECRHKTSKRKSYIHYKTTEDFIKLYFIKWPKSKYDLSLVLYKNPTDKINIICPIHGKFAYKASALMCYGTVCPKCNHDKVFKKRITRIKNALELCIKKYSEYLSTNNIDFNIAQLLNLLKNSNWKKEKYVFKCNFHGNFLLTFELLELYYKLNVSPCINCRGKITTRKYTTLEFIDILKKLYDDKQYNYDYSDTEYINWHTKVKIICNKHGIFYREPSRLFEGRGCPYCKESLLERDIRLFLILNNIDFIYQYRNKPILGKKSLDFFLPKFNIAIECQGKLHLNIDSIFNYADTIDDLYKYDIIKLLLCELNGIKVLYYSNIKVDNYFSKMFNNKYELLLEILKNAK